MAERRMSCSKRCFATEADAAAWMAELIARAKATHQGKASWRRLNVYRCFACRAYHVGRANQRPKEPPKPAKQIPTTGELRRKLRHLEREWLRREDRRRRHLVEQIGLLVQRDMEQQQILEQIRAEAREIEAQLFGR